jgi:large subunit ribosomal protein L15
MKYHELNVTPNRTKKRVGRGISAGQGKTAGRGTKGQNSRTGKKLKATFMGGQRSLMQAVPKSKGFKSLRAPAQVVYVESLNNLKASVADNASLYKAGLVASPHHTVKIIVKGELKNKLTVNVQAASKSAVAAIVKAGGTFTKVEVPLKMSEKQPKK